MAKRYPVSSLTSGALNDGALEGQINESLHNAVLSNVQIADSRYLLRMDYDVGQFADLSTLINSQVVFPWGTTATMTTGDGFLIACNDDIDSIFLNITTVGVGTWTALQLFDSTNGSTFNREITGFTDNTNALKSSGWRDIVVPSSFVDGRVSFSPSPVLGVASRKWILIKPVGTFTVTTAPQISAAVVRHIDTAIKWINLTTFSNGSLTVAPTGVQFHPTVGSVVAYFFDGLPVGWERYVFQQQANARTRVLRYATNTDGTSFSDLQNAVDASNDFTVTPSTQPQKFSVRWTPPSDAVKVTRTFTLTDDTTFTVTSKYMVIIETTAITSIAPINPTLSRVRAKQLGDAGTSGVLTSPKTIKRVTLKRHGSAVGTGAINYQIYNFTKEQSVTLSFPDNDANLEQNYDVVDLNFSDGDKRGLYHASGSRVINDLEVEYHQ